MTTLRDRFEEQERKNREQRERIKRIHERNIATGISATPQQVIQPSTTPFIPQGQQAQVQADLNAQRTAFTPLGDIGVGTKAAAPDTRGKPEFGSFWGSGILENTAGGVLPALENLQKGLETFGGAAVSLADIAPGELFASQNQGRGFTEILDEVQEERRASGRPDNFMDWAGQAQDLAEAFRRTDMPSTQVSLPGQGIPLPGGRKIDDIDVGVKGVIELLPEIILGVATGGTSAGASLGRKTGISILNAFGADIAMGAVKLGSKGGRQITRAAIQAPAVIGKTPEFTDISKLSARIDRVRSQGTIDAINKLPERIRGLEIRRRATSAMSALSPARVVDTTRAAVKATLLNSMALDEISKKNELAMAEFAKRLSFAGIKLPTEVQEFTGKAEGVPFSTSFIVEPGAQGGADKIISGLIGDTGIPAIDDGLVIGKARPKTYKMSGDLDSYSTKKVLGEEGGTDTLFHGTRQQFDAGEIQLNSEGQIWLTDSQEGAEIFSNMAPSKLTPAGLRTDSSMRSGRVLPYQVKSGAKIYVVNNTGRLTQKAIDDALAAAGDADIVAMRSVSDVPSLPSNASYYVVKNPKVLELPGESTKNERRLKFSYNEVMENFFKTGSTNVPRFLDKAGKPVKGAKTLPKGGMTNPKWEEAVMARREVAKEFGGANIGSWSIVAEKYVPDITTKTGTVAAKAGKAARAAKSDTPRGSVKLTKLQKQEITDDMQPSAEELFYATDDLGGVGDAKEIAFLRKFTGKNGNVVLPDTISNEDLISLREYADNAADKVSDMGDLSPYTPADRSEIARRRSTARSLKSVVAKIDALPVRKGRKAVDAVPPVKGVDAFEAFDPVAAEFATYVRHWQDTVKAIELNYIAASGKKIKGTAVLDKVSSRYSPRNNNGDYLLEDADIANNTTRIAFSGGTPGRKNKALNKRELRNAEVRELVNEGGYSLSNPMVALKQHDLSMRKAAWDAQLTKHLKAAAKRKGSGVIEIAPRKARTAAAINRITSGKTDKLNPKTIADIREQFRNTANVLVKAMKHGKDTKARQTALKTIQDVFAKDVETLEDGTYLVTKPGAVRTLSGSNKEKTVIRRENRMPAYTGLYFEDKAEVNRLIKQHYPNTKLTDESSIMATTNSFSKILAETGDIIRLGRTGFDFGYWMIQGLPSLGFAVAKSVDVTSKSNSKLGRDLVKIWVKSVPEAFKAFRSQDRMMLSLADDVNLVDEAITYGLQIGITSTDAFQAVQNGTILRKLGDPVDGFGTKADKLLTKAADPFQRAFIAPGDYIRVQMYKAMRPVAFGSNGEDGLRELSSVLNNMTGAFSSSAAGVHPTMQNVERGIIAFSARYTRSSLALLTAVFRGGIEGRTARESMAGMVGLGAAAYITAVEAINLAGGKQELHLDPTKSQFMTFDVGGDKLGFGSFWTQFAKVTSKTSAIAWDEDAREAFLGDDTLRTNPLIRWVRSRSAPGFAGTAWDIAVGEDFLGRDIEGPKDWTVHVGRQTLPIWLEAGVIGDPHRTGMLGLAGEIAGARVRPLSSKERRRDLRDSIAQDLYDKDWVDINGLQRERINAGEVEISVSEAEELKTLNEEVLAANVERGDEDDLVIEKYHKRHTDIEDEWNENIAEGIELLTSHPGIMDLEKFRHMYLSSANSIRRSKLEELNNPEGDFALAIEYFEKTSERFGEDKPEDIAYNQYITNILATDDFDIPGGFDYEARDMAIKSFQTIWGDEVFAYVQERFATGRNIPELVNEFWQGRKRFEYYWADVDEATLATMPNSTALEPAYKEWTRASENRRSELEEVTPYLKAMIQKVSRVKRAMREQDPLLDAWLFRWGFTNTFASPQNEFSPDGVNDAAQFWRDPKPMQLNIFGIQNGIAL